MTGGSELEQVLENITEQGRLWRWKPMMALPWNQFLTTLNGEQFRIPKDIQYMIMDEHYSSYHGEPFRYRNDIRLFTKVQTKIDVSRCQYRGGAARIEIPDEWKLNCPSVKYMVCLRNSLQRMR